MNVVVPGDNAPYVAERMDEQALSDLIGGDIAQTQVDGLWLWARWTGTRYLPYNAYGSLLLQQAWGQNGWPLAFGTCVLTGISLRDVEPDQITAHLAAWAAYEQEMGKY